MLQKLFSGKDRVFIPLFHRHVELIARAGVELQSALELTDPRLIANKRKAITELEHEGDIHIKEILQKLYQTFFAPYDHEDIKDLANTLDNILDAIEGVMNLHELYQLKGREDFFQDFGRLIAKAANLVEEMIKAMQKTEECRPFLEKIDLAEHQSDTKLSAALFELFQNETDALTVIKYKEFYEQLEQVVDCMKDASDVVEGIILKYS